MKSRKVILFRIGNNNSCGCTYAYSRNMHLSKNIYFLQVDLCIYEVHIFRNTLFFPMHRLFLLEPQGEMTSAYASRNNARRQSWISPIGKSHKRIRNHASSYALIIAGQMKSFAITVSLI